MISVNGVSIDFTSFPDNTTSFRYNPCCFEYNILWRYDDDTHLMKRLQNA